MGDDQTTTFNLTDSDTKNELEIILAEVSDPDLREAYTKAWNTTALPNTINDAVFLECFWNDDEQLFCIPSEEDDYLLILDLPEAWSYYSYVWDSKETWLGSNQGTIEEYEMQQNIAWKHNTNLIKYLAGKGFDPYMEGQQYDHIKDGVTVENYMESAEFQDYLTSINSNHFEP